MAATVSTVRISVPVGTLAARLLGSPDVENERGRRKSALPQTGFTLIVLTVLKFLLLNLNFRSIPDPQPRDSRRPSTEGALRLAVDQGGWTEAPCSI